MGRGGGFRDEGGEEALSADHRLSSEVTETRLVPGNLHLDAVVAEGGGMACLVLCLLYSDTMDWSVFSVITEYTLSGSRIDASASDEESVSDP